MNAVIKNLLMRSLAKLSRRPRVKVSLERLEGLVVDIGAGGEGMQQLRRSWTFLDIFE